MTKEEKEKKELESKEEKKPGDEKKKDAKDKKEEDDGLSGAPLGAEEIKFMQNYGRAAYAATIKALAHPSQWDMASDQQRLSQEQPLKVARCTRIIQGEGNDPNKYMINLRNMAKYVVELGERVAVDDIEEDMRVGVDRTKYKIQTPLPPRIDPSVTMMTVEEKPDVTYDDCGGLKEQIQQLKEG